MSEWTTIDKSDWGPGPWQAEPDKIHWVDEATDLDCLMHRSFASGGWCGYVAVPPGHPAYEADYSTVDVDVHGGLTYADFCQNTTDESIGVCHTPLPGRPHQVWWLGFDCGHLYDYSPKLTLLTPNLAEYTRDDVYRDRAWVENEVRSLAAQLKAMA